MPLKRKIRKMTARGLHRDKFQISHRLGLNWLLNYRNAIDRYLLVDGNFEGELLAFFRNWVTEAGCTRFIDIGANIGLFTCQISQLDQITEVHALEPSKTNLYQLHGNLLINGLVDKVSTYQVGASDHQGKISFLENLGNSTGRSRISETNFSPLKETAFREIHIDVTTIDTLFPDWQQEKVAVKIDVEGHELKTLTGMKSLLTNNTVYVQVECYDDNRSEMDRMMRDLGYEMVKTIGADLYYQPANLS